ncbi:transcriptional regulator [Periweissella cryptocerci]|uniref:Transcriptional regulator n=1 Tax=Periweissella cryptocerci TaxID=2506420 RepID=A0A4P6YVZ6_9LACO|nr:helix-turn-helix domain-containing protein [Periweissella cryptocerci]QBO36933.1 transcriptional regulator [Periweissella cryptocerci]
MENVTKDGLSLCPKFAKTFEILGRKWNGMIIEVLLNNGVSRFKDLAAAVQNCSDRVLVERLKELEEEGIVERRTYEDSALINYALTERGTAMRSMMDAIHEWADQTYAQAI